MIKLRLSLVLIIYIFFINSIHGAGSTRFHEIKSFVSGNIPVQNQNWGIYQHPINKLVYFANSEGLIEYDGLTTNTYKLPGNKGARSVFIDNNGLIFTGGFEELGFWQKDSGCKLRYISLAKHSQIKDNDEIWKIYQQHGKIYFQSFTSIYIYDYKTIKNAPAPFTVLFMFPKTNGFLVQVLGIGLYNFDNDKYSIITGSSLFSTVKIHTIVPYPNNSYLIGTANNGLYILKDEKITPFPCEVSEFLKYNTCNAGVAINDSTFVFGTILGGIIEFNTSGTIKRTFNYSNGLKNNTVLSLFKDNDNGIWAGLDQGTNYLETFSPMVQYQNVTGTLGTIYTILKKDDLLYIGTNQGLFTAKIDNFDEHYSFTDVEMVPGSQGQVWTLREFNNQVLCGHNEGTFVAGKGSFRQISWITGGWTLSTLKEYIIQGTYTGLVTLEKDEKGNWKFRNKIKGYDQPSRRIEVDYLGFIWASHHQRGIYKLELNDKLDSVQNEKFFGGITGTSGNIDVFKINNRIIFTGSDKLYSFDYDANKIVAFKILNDQLGEFSKAVQVIPFEGTQYWLVLENKIALFDINRDFRSRKILEFSQKDIHTSGNDLEIIKTGPRNILFPTRSGFAILNTSNVKNLHSASRVFFKSITFQGKGKTIEVCGSNGPIKVPYTTNNIRVFFSDPSAFNMNEKIYYYRITELEDQWHTTTIDNFSYNNVRFGSYTVEIKTDVNSVPVSLKFVIKAPWYLTYYAFAAYTLLFILINYLVYCIFRYELEKQKKMVAMEVRRDTLENELDIKSNELMLTMRYLIQKNEILTELKKEIDALKEQSAKYPIKHIRNLEKIIDEGLDTQTESWKSAMSNLKLSQEGFFRRLKEKHPELTPNDLRLCSYLRMNFTTKEIAHLLNISGRGVEIGRYRLRKKMNLPHDINLSEYLMGS
jgi:DNA-binding CsgD family transcriptional regulator